MRKFFSKIKIVLTNKKAEGYMDTAIKMIIAVVIGGLLLGGLYYLFNSIVLPGIAVRMQNVLTSTVGSLKDVSGISILY